MMDVGEDRRFFLEGSALVGKRAIEIKCPCCGWRLFDLEPGPQTGGEVIRIKCPRCKGVAAIKPKKYVLSK